MLIRTFAYLVTVLCCQYVYATNYYVGFKSGIMAIITSSDRLLSVLTINENSIQFHDDVLIQFVTHDFDDGLHLDFLAEELFFFLGVNPQLNRVYTGSQNNEIERNFFAMSQTGNVLSEYHQGGTEINISSGDKSVLLADAFISQAIRSVFKLQCSFGCGSNFKYSADKSRHHKHEHPKEYRQLKDMFKEGSHCKQCGTKIKNIFGLGPHLKSCPIAKSFLDFL